MTRACVPRGRVLVVAGSDSGGGAGIQADIKTIMALGGYACTAVTALTAQDTTGVHGVMRLPAGFVRAQIECVLGDIGADAVKTGMLASADVVAEVADVLARHPGMPLVLDPVMLAKGGASLLDPDAVAMLRGRLMPLASLLTPNVPEAEALTGRRIARAADLEPAARALLAMGPRAVLLKGGHLDGEEVVDLLVTGAHSQRFTASRAHTRHTHGTGCTLASGVAAGLARGLSLQDAVARAHAYVQRAIAAAPGFGAGHGPLGHAEAWRDGEAADAA